VRKFLIDYWESLIRGGIIKWWSIYSKDMRESWTSEKVEVTLTEPLEICTVVSHVVWEGNRSDEFVSLFYV